MCELNDFFWCLCVQVLTMIFRYQSFHFSLIIRMKFWNIFLVTRSHLHFEFEALIHFRRQKSHGKQWKSSQAFKECVGCGNQSRVTILEIRGERKNYLRNQSEKKNNLRKFESFTPYFQNMGKTFKIWEKIWVQISKMPKIVQGLSEDLLDHLQFGCWRPPGWILTPQTHKKKIIFALRAKTFKESDPKKISTTHSHTHTHSTPFPSYWVVQKSV